MSRDIQEIISDVVGASVGVIVLRDPSDGSQRFSVVYESRGTYWQCRHRFESVDHAQAACLTLGDFLGARVQL